MEKVFKKEFRLYKASYLTKRSKSAAEQALYAEYKDLENDLHKIFYKSFVKLKISAASSTASEIKESLAYPLSQLLSDIAGITGVYLGFSVLTLLEIWELVVKMKALLLRTMSQYFRSNRVRKLGKKAMGKNEAKY